MKSAMMTTAGDVVNADGSKNTDVHATGAGQVDPARMVDPGLVYDANEEDYWKFIQGTGINLGLPSSTLPRDMNVPSFSLGNLTGKIEVTRTVTALTPGVYKVKANVPGVKVSVRGRHLEAANGNGPEGEVLGSTRVRDVRAVRGAHESGASRPRLTKLPHPSDWPDAW